MPERDVMADRPACRQMREVWDAAVDDFLAGGPAVPPSLKRWAEAYRGRGRGTVTLDAFPEPYLGSLDGEIAGVFLALNPGHAHLDFQSRSGLFADEIRRAGRYAAWAATSPICGTPGSG